MGSMFDRAMADLNKATLFAFGESISYQRGSDPAFPVKAVRCARERDQEGMAQSWEALEVDPFEFPGERPAIGDQVTLAEVSYTVKNVNQPYPAGMIRLALQRNA